jgi:hypothetical protein
MSKVEKEQADYTPVAAMKDQRCDKCKFFLPLYETCMRVKGHVKPGAWCKFWKHKNGEEKA